MTIDFKKVLADINAEFDAKINPPVAEIGRESSVFKSDPKYWSCGGDVLTVGDKDGVRAVVFLDQSDIDNLTKWYSQDPSSTDAVDFFLAVQGRDQWRRVLYSE